MTAHDRAALAAAAASAPLAEVLPPPEASRLDITARAGVKSPAIRRAPTRRAGAARAARG